MVQTAIQLFTLADVEEPLPELVARVGETTFDGVEFYDAHFDALADEEIRSRTRTALEDADLEVAGAHVGIDRLESNFEDLVSVCRDVGCSTLVVPSYEREAFTTREGVEAAADRIAGLAADLGDHDIDLLYHNHTFEFESADDEVAFEVFVEEAGDRFGFEPDVGLATHAGYDAQDLLSLVADRSPIVHLTDTVPGNDDDLHADVGDGVVDIRACADTAVANGAEWLVCENGRTDDALASLEHGSEAFADLHDRV